MTKWQKKLTKAQRKHLTEWGITSLRALRRTIDHQQGMLDRGVYGSGCHDCTQIFNRLHDAGVKIPTSEQARI